MEHTENDVSNNTSTVVAMVMFSLSQRLAKAGGLLPSCSLAKTVGGTHGRTHTHTDRQTEELMKHAVEMGSGAMIYI
jgi:hypothetical protein